MAIRLQDKPNTDAPDSDYPYGNIKDKIDGVQEGTPVDKEVYADFHQFFAKMFAESGLVYNGLPDNDYSGFQYYEALLEVLKGDDWVDATLESNVANIGSTFANAGYQKDGSGVVRLRGAVVASSVSAGVAKKLFTLPVGYRPEYEYRFTVYYSRTTGSIDTFSDNGFMAIGVYANGEVYLLNPIGTSNYNLEISAISFRVA